MEEEVGKSLASANEKLIKKKARQQANQQGRLN